MKRFFFIFPFLLFVCSCTEFSSSTSNPDVLQDSIRFYIAQADEYPKSDQEVLSNLEKATSILQLQPKDSLYFVNQFYVGFIYDNIGKKESFKNIMLELVEEAVKANDSVNLARAYSYVGEYFLDQRVMDSAVIHFQKAEKIFFKLKNNVGIGRMHVKMATAKNRARDYLGSEKSAVTALTYIRLEQNKLLEYEAYNILGITCLDIKDYDKAEEYFEKAYNIALTEPLKDLGQYQTKAITLNNLGLVGLKSGKYLEAKQYFAQAISEPFLIEEYPSLYATVVSNLAKTRFKLEDLKSLQKDYHKALRLRKSLQAVPEIVNSKIDLSEYYQKIGRLDSASFYARAAYKMAKKTNIINLQMLAVDQLSHVEPENENTYSKEYIRLSDSLLALERKVTEKFARIEYETDEIMRQKEQLAIQYRTSIFFFVLALFIAALLFVIRYQRNRNIKLQFREAQQRANEEIYNLMLGQQKKVDEVIHKEKQRIAQELHDGVLGRLFGTRLNLDSLNTKKDEQAIENRHHYISELKNIEQDIREISHELNREKFELINNFVSILTNLFEEQKSISSATLQTKIDPAINWVAMNNAVKINVYRIIQESLQNCNKYAKAKTISVNLEQEKDQLHLSILDDGQGFDVAKKSKGIGIQNIASRVKTCGGTLTLKSLKGIGTTLEVIFPIESPVKNKSL